jgi:thiol-disulfide isomerase/thioredoxin
MVNWLTAFLMLGFVGGSSDRMIVEFTKDNCVPCKQLQPSIERLKQQGWTVRTVNTDREPLTVRRFSVQSVPTLIILDGGREIDRIVGAAPYEKLAIRLELLDQKTPVAGTANANIDTPALLPSARPAGHTNSSSQLAPALEPLPLLSATPANFAANNAPRNSNPSLTVRGQSPGIGAFPMLNSVANVAAAASEIAAPVQQAIQREGKQIASQLKDATINAEKEINRFAPGASVQPAGGGPFHATATVNLEQAIKRAEAATVRIRVDEERSTAFGTGTIVDVHGDEALVLTCGHIFREMKPHSQLTVDLYNGQLQPYNLPAQLIDFQANDGQPDIGLLSFRLPFAVEPVPLLPKGESLSKGQPAFSFGCDHGENPTRRDTQIKNINRYIGPANIEIAGAPAVGRSGGGLFDNQGRMIGVCNAADAADDEGIYAAADVVYAQINRLGLSHLFANNSSPLAAVQLASARGGAAAVSPQTPPAREGKDSIIQWPDEQAGKNQLVAQSADMSAPQQLTCIIRDAQGNDKIVTIKRAPPELIQAIQRHSEN